ncbi:MAG: alpha-xylosidase [Chloroflexi bacterium HGW-Chloroflexi-5]|jgi:alpha-glucosidase (family GH31 glycosyl hydrolase)|nr:MAG: alpha-xylosidase [Chloroflexi bacterium HGW-Chloroflexi-5]
MTPHQFFVPPLSASTANPQAIIRFENFRFTPLTERLLRIEFSNSVIFEDRPSQVFWYRNQPIPKMEIEQTPVSLLLETSHYKLTCERSPKGTNLQSIQILIKASNQIIHIDDPNPGLLPSTTRTLDEADGAIPLKPGLLSRSGWTQIDDTSSLLFNSEGWLKPRLQTSEYRDLYFLISGSDYKSALQDYQKIAGTPGLLPRAFLGNWWSRYWEYTQQDLQHLVERFSREEIPLSTLIIDMDWHITQTGNDCSGWTGFSWNRTLFPDPPALLTWLHERGLISALNLHPAEGIHAHEDQYPAAATALGVDPQSRKPLPFNIADAKFAQTYFDHILHPIEDQGVDFWWLDWQQGEFTQLPGLDPLWWLNHLHYFDLGQTNAKRPVIFSRWGGPGNHRYPIGFSGDTIVSWQSLAFQPWFTASAANAAYGWWSHDVGGHMRGMEDPELYVRWVQFGVLSPIFRLHSTKDEFIDRHPWHADAEVLKLTREAMQFRHALIPYLYSMAHRNQQQGLPPITPLYYDWPTEDAAYIPANQYMFGTELMAAPVTSPLDPEIGKAKQGIWFPPGDWFEFFSGIHHAGGRWEITFNDLEEIPLFAKAGSIIPLQAETTHNGVANPQKIDLHVFPVQDGVFTLYEDDGTSQNYIINSGATTYFQTHNTDSTFGAVISPVEGESVHIPVNREYRILFRGVNRPESITASLDDLLIEVKFSYDADTRTAATEPIALSSNQGLTVEMHTQPGQIIAEEPDLKTRLIPFLKGMKINNVTKWKIGSLINELQKDLSCLLHQQIKLTPNQKIALLEMITRCGAVILNHPINGNKFLVVNPDQQKGFAVRQSRNIKVNSNGSIISQNKGDIFLEYFGMVQKKF